MRRMRGVKENPDDHKLEVVNRKPKTDSEDQIRAKKKETILLLLVAGKNLEARMLEAEGD